MILETKKHQAFIDLLWQLDEGERGLEYIFADNSKISLSLLSDNHVTDDTTCSMYWLHVEDKGSVSGSYIVGITYDLHTEVKGKYMNNHLGVAAEPTTLSSILEMLPEAKEVYLNTFKIKDWDNFKELCLISD